jgi:anti-sigma-K factor RskA
VSTENDHERWAENVAPYMLGALEPQAAAEFKRHLEGCEKCRSEVRWFTAAVETLPESVPLQKPSPALRERLMAEVRADARTAQTASAAGDGHRFRLPAWLGGRAVHDWRPLAALAAVALLLVAFAGYEIGSGGGGGSDSTSTIVAGQAPGVTAKVERSGDSAQLRLANVDELPEDRVLEAWVQREGEVEPVEALFVPDREGNASTMIPDMSGVEVVMVTKEPSGGSESPTSSPIVTVSIPQ